MNENNYLERLKPKPNLDQNAKRGVNVILKRTTEPALKETPVVNDLMTGTKIITDKDNGNIAQEINNRLKQRNKLNVTKKIIDEPKINVPLETKVDVTVKPVQKPVPLKKTQKFIIMDDVEQKEGQELEQKEGQELEQKEGRLEEPKKKTRISKKPPKGVIELGPENMIVIGDTSIEKRLPPNPIFDVKVSGYYMNNREIFVNFINGLFETYKDELLDETKGISCDDIGKDTGNIGLLTHQKIVRDYINLYSPYRGLLLFHGLGSGKTCSSIAIAEGIKSSKKVIIMTPASLRRNYIEEIKKCGDLLYRKNQFWEWISIETDANLVDALSSALKLPREYIRRQRGAWLVNITKKSNYTELSSSDKKVLNDQIDEMIKNKYTFINYNGLRRNRFKELTNNFETNIFDNSVVIIDESHNLISRIVNKINSIPKFTEKKRGPGFLIPKALVLILYEFLLIADDCRIVMLTGTPIINYPNEIGILFNILRGYIKTWSFTLSTETTQKLSKDTLQTMFNREKVLDYINYIPSSKTLTVTRNPFGFENIITKLGYKGVTNEVKEKRNELGEIEKDDQGNVIYNERGQLSDTDFIYRITKILRNNQINAVTNGTNYTVNVALPDTLYDFVDNFINQDTGNIANVDKFKRRIMGLTSYFRSAQEELLPVYDKYHDRHEIYIPMSDYQFKVYEEYRQKEREREAPSKKQKGIVDADGMFKEPSSTYRIFSRLACNFVMPQPPGRPQPVEYRILKKLKKKQEIYLLLQKKYFDNKEMYDEEINKKLEEFREEELAPEVIKNEELQRKFKETVDLYVIDYLKDNLKNTSIRQYFENRAEWYYFKNRQPQTTNIAKQNDDIKETDNIKVTEKEKAKRERDNKKAEEKREKDERKAEEKREKDERKAEEKRLRDEKKAEEKRERDEKKAEEKRERDEKKAEEKRLRDEKKKRTKGGGSDSDTESDTDSSDLEGDLEGGADTPPEDMLKIYEENDEENIIIEGYKDEDAALRDINELESDELLELMGNVEYKEAIKTSLRYLKLHSKEYLSVEGLKTYSPKFLAMLENIEDHEHAGLHLIYSQFRSMEGIGIFSLVLEANGYANFKIKRNDYGGWDININEEDIGKPCYALYTGTEDAEEREILRNIYNGQWDYVPNNIATQLRSQSTNNNLGEVIKILMITSAGSEGINLRNTRYVHIMEPYWHPVRSEQVIGRARRICSHQGLPKNLQTVEVFIYIMTFTQQQLDSDFAIELRLKDLSKREPYLPQTSDQKLHEISTIKEQLTSQLLKSVKETAIDCATHIKSSSKEGLVCLSFGQKTANDYSFNPNYTQDENDNIAELNKEKIEWDAVPFTFKATGKRYMLRKDTKQVYDYDSVIQAKQIPGVRPILIGKLVKNSSGAYEIIKEIL
jgi:hypothetical protein